MAPASAGPVETRMSRKKVISTRELRELLHATYGEDVVIDVQPGVDNTIPPQWVFDPSENEGYGGIARLDGKFHVGKVTQHPGGYMALGLDDEGQVSWPEDGSPRIIGHIVVEVNPRGYIRTREAMGWNGPYIEVFPSSTSKGQLASGSLTPDALVQTNPQRIYSWVAAYKVETEFPDTEGLTLEEFRAQSTDLRSLGAVLKVLGTN